MSGLLRAVLTGAVLAATAVAPAYGQAFPRARYAGYLCSIVAGPAGDGGRISGTVTGGDMVVVGATTVTMTCKIYVGRQPVLERATTACSATEVGMIARCQGEVSYPAAARDVWLCTNFSWKYLPVGRTHHWHGVIGDTDGSPYCDRIRAED